VPNLSLYYHPILYNPELQRQKHQQQQHSSSSSSGGSNALKSFINALKSSDAQKQYPVRLRLFFNLIGLPGTLEEQAESFVEKSKGLGGGGPQWTQDCIISFVNHYKQRVMRKEIATGTLNNYYMAVKLFCEMNDLATGVNWKRISRGLPRLKLAANDRAPTIEEIRNLVEYPDRRIKAIVYCMASGGFRIGSWEYLRWKHIIPITDNNKQDEKKIIAAKLIIYAEESEEYYTFITPEAYNALKTWMDFRASYGEKITPESWLCVIYGRHQT
jgi:integrase